MVSPLELQKKEIVVKFRGGGFRESKGHWESKSVPLLHLSALDSTHSLSYTVFAIHVG
jgi:hypothetical protein